MAATTGESQASRLAPETRELPWAEARPQHGWLSALGAWPAASASQAETQGLEAPEGESVCLCLVQAAGRSRHPEGHPGFLEGS